MNSLAVRKNDTKNVVALIAFIAIASLAAFAAVLVSANPAFAAQGISTLFGEAGKIAEEIVQMIVRRICSRKKTERICGQDFPREVVKSTMLKVDINVLENAIEQMKRADNVRNYESYLISTLFNEANGKRFKENAEGRWAEYAVKRDFGVYDD